MAAFDRLKLDTAIGVVGLAVGLPPLLKDYLFARSPPRRLRGGVQLPVDTSSRARKPPSVEGGMYGGLVGGTLAGLLIGTAYYVSVLQDPRIAGSDGANPASPFSVVGPVILFSALAGALLGLTIEMGTRLISAASQSLFQAPGNLDAFLGGLTGGFITGLIMGPIGGLYFGRRDLPIVDPSLTVLLSAPGTIILTMSIIYFQSAMGFRKIALSAVLSTVLSFSLFLFVLTFSTAFGVTTWISMHFVDPAPENLLVGGAYFGVFCGAIFGASIGLSNSLIRVTTPATSA
jgi:hypothetical protein